MIPVILGLLVTPLAFIVNGWALSILWGWFIAPLFGLPGLAVPQAIGVALVVSLLTAQDVATDREPWEALLRGVLVSFGAPAIALLVGWIVQFLLPA